MFKSNHYCLLYTVNLFLFVKQQRSKRPKNQICGLVYSIAMKLYTSNTQENQRTAIKFIYFDFIKKKLTVEEQLISGVCITAVQCPFYNGIVTVGCSALYWKLTWVGDRDNSDKQSWPSSHINHNIRARNSRTTFSLGRKRLTKTKIGLIYWPNHKYSPQITK
jgi:hypothetical protein